jgi:hypothetical protein
VLAFPSLTAINGSILFTAGPLAGTMPEPWPVWEFPKLEYVYSLYFNHESWGTSYGKQVGGGAEDECYI